MWHFKFQLHTEIVGSILDCKGRLATLNLTSWEFKWRTTWWVVTFWQIDFLEKLNIYIWQELRTFPFNSMIGFYCGASRQEQSITTPASMVALRVFSLEIRQPTITWNTFSSLNSNIDSSEVVVNTEKKFSSLMEDMVRLPMIIQICSISKHINIS